MTPTEFHFLGSGFEDGPDVLCSPDSYLTIRGPGENWESNELDLPRSCNIPEAIDQFCSVHDSGIVAGWVSYDAGLHMNGLELNDDPSYEHLPLIWLGHFERDTKRTDTGRNATNEELQLGPLTSDVTEEEYHRSIDLIHRLIRRGYVYQINYSQRFSGSCNGSIRGLIPRDISLVPPQSVYFRWEDHEVLSLSPERFFRTDGRKILTQPIKGTRPRKEGGSENQRIVRNLKNSLKDEAEHVMIVDLERNDLNRICEVGSVTVPELKSHYEFETVHHLISTVEGQLKTETSLGEIFDAIFPGGSVTGAPKEISIRLINHIERRRRGLYTGTIGYFDLDRDVADWNIVIRTLIRSGDRAWWDAGGGIVIDSDAKREYSESLDKVALLERMRSKNREDCLEPTRS